MRSSITVAGQLAMNYDDANRLTQITQGMATVTIGYDNANRWTSTPSTPTDRPRHRGAAERRRSTAARLT